MDFGFSTSRETQGASCANGEASFRNSRFRLRFLDCVELDHALFVFDTRAFIRDFFWPFTYRLNQMTRVFDDVLPPA